jgi:hypothetical protein
VFEREVFRTVAILYLGSRHAALAPHYPAQYTRSGLALTGELEAVGGASCHFKLKLAIHASAAESGKIEPKKKLQCNGDIRK